MSTHSPSKKRRHQVARALVLLAGAFALSSHDLAGQPTVQSQQTGTLFYPNTGSTSVGNETQVSFSDSQTLNGAGPALAGINETRSGTDFNGTTGTVNVNGTTDSRYGLLSSTNQIYAESTPLSGLAPFPHGGGFLDGAARFDDTITISNPSYGGSIPVTLRASVSWDHGYDLGFGGSNTVTNWAFAQTGLEWFGSLMLYNLQQKTDNFYNEHLEASGSLAGNALNSATLHVWGTLATRSAAALNAQGTVSAPYGQVSSYSNAAADFYFEVPVGTVITSASGHDYTRSSLTTNSVPEEASWQTTGLALLFCGWMLRRRGRA